MKRKKFALSETITVRVGVSQKKTLAKLNSETGLNEAELVRIAIIKISQLPVAEIYSAVAEVRK